MIKKQILIVGPNPSYQRVLCFEKFATGEVNRAVRKYEFASGKGINSARAAATWNQCSSVVLQFAGGETGDKLLSRLIADNIHNIAIPTANESRRCTTIISPEGITELIEPSFPPSENELSRFIAELSAAQADGIILCGTAPGNISEEFYRQCGLVLKNFTGPIILDAASGAREFLATARASVLKINASELAKITNIRHKTPAAKNLLENYNIGNILVTDGSSPAQLFTAAGQVLTYTLPKLNHVMNTIGSGDIVNGVLMSEILRSVPIIEACKFALSAGSAGCLNIFCGHFAVTDAADIYAKITIKENIE